MSDILETMREYAKFAENKSEREAFDAVINEITTLRARLAPVDDEALVEIAVRTHYGKKWDDPENGPGEAMKEVWRNLYRKPLAAIRPHIEAAERDRCAKIAEGSFLFDIETWLNSTKKEMTAHVAKAIATAIRSGK